MIGWRSKMLEQRCSPNKPRRNPGAVGQVPKYAGFSPDRRDGYRCAQPHPTKAYAARAILRITGMIG